MFIIIATLFAIAVAGVRLIGINVYKVMSSSMEPNVPVGSIIWVKDIDDPSELKVDDVITFKLQDNSTATHRIVRILPSDTDPSGYVFITKGDNNDGEDNPLSPSLVIGKEILTIPKLGYVAHYIQNKPGNYVAIGVCVAFIILLFIIDLLSDDDEANNKKSKKKGAKAETEAEAPKQNEIQNGASDAPPIPADDGETHKEGETK